MLLKGLLLKNVILHVFLEWKQLGIVVEVQKTGHQQLLLGPDKPRGLK